MVDVTKPYDPAPALGTIAICICGAAIHYAGLEVVEDHLLQRWTSRINLSIDQCVDSIDGHHHPRKEHRWFDRSDASGYLPMTFVLGVLQLAERNRQEMLEGNLGVMAVIDMAYMPPAPATEPVVVNNFEYWSVGDWVFNLELDRVIQIRLRGTEVVGTAIRLQ